MSEPRCTCEKPTPGSMGRCLNCFLLNAASQSTPAPERHDAPSGKQPSISLAVYQHDWIPGFAAFHEDGSIAEGAQAHVVLNLGSLLCAVAAGDLPKEDLPYMVAECLMHETMHALESWAGIEFSEERVEKLLNEYHAKYGEGKTHWVHDSQLVDDANNTANKQADTEKQATPVTNVHADSTPKQETAREPHDGWMNAWLYNNIPRDQNCLYMWNPETRKMAGDWADFRVAHVTASLRADRDRFEKDSNYWETKADDEELARVKQALHLKFLPMSQAPMNAKEVYGLIEYKGQFEVRVIHYAEDLSGSEQPPFKGWFYQVGDHSYNAVNGAIHGWAALAGKEQGRNG